MKNRKNDLEYEALKRFLSWACDNDEFLGKGEPEAHPIFILTEAEKIVPPSRLKSGLKEAVNDVIQRFSNWSEERVRAADEELIKIGGPTLIEMRNLFSAELKFIEKRGMIETEEECLLLRKALEMPMFQASSKRAEKIRKMLYEYEVG